MDVLYQLSYYGMALTSAMPLAGGRVANLYQVLTNLTILRLEGADALF